MRSYKYLIRKSIFNQYSLKHIRNFMLAKIVLSEKQRLLCKVHLSFTKSYRWSRGKKGEARGNRRHKYEGQKGESIQRYDSGQSGAASKKNPAGEKERKRACDREGEFGIACRRTVRPPKQPRRRHLPWE